MEDIFKIIRVKEIDKYRDGGTISIYCDIYDEKGVREVQITIDKRIDSKNKGKLWIGYPEKKGSRLVLKKHYQTVEEATKRYIENINIENNNVLECFNCKG